MNVLLWVFQVLLAIHTAIGAVWKFSHTAEGTMPSLKAIPQSIWLSMSVIELFLSVCLILPVFSRRLGMLVPIAAICIAAEMLLFTGVHFNSGDTKWQPAIYWLIVAAICGFIALGRLVLKPL